MTAQGWGAGHEGKGTRRARSAGGARSAAHFGNGRRAVCFAQSMMRPQLASHLHLATPPHSVLIP